MANFVRITCPHCGTLMPPPFLRMRCAIANTHSKKYDPHGSRCRVIVVPSETDEQHEVIKVKDGERFEDVFGRWAA